MGKGNVARFTAGATIHTDDNALVEFAAPRGLTLGIYQWPLVEAIEQYREADLSFLTSSEQDAKALAEAKTQTSRLIEAQGEVYQAYFLQEPGRIGQDARTAPEGRLPQPQRRPASRSPSIPSEKMRSKWWRPVRSMAPPPFTDR